MSILGFILFLSKQNDKRVSRFEYNIERKKEQKEKDKVRKEKIASYFFDLSKVTYTVLVVGVLVTIIQNESYRNISLNVGVLIGCMLAILFARIGNNILKK